MTVGWPTSTHFDANMAGRFVMMNTPPPVDTTELIPERGNPIEDYSDEKFLKEFRMTKDEARYVSDLVKDDMKCLGNRKTDLTLEQKVLVCLKTLASGSFQNCSKDVIKTSQPVVSKLMTAFTDSMEKRLSSFVNMPTGAEMEEMTVSFYQVFGFPGVRACLDCTHIPIKAPVGPDEAMYVNRKGFHSINVQAMCDANLVFVDVVAKWHGSHHDSFILVASNIHDRFENGEFGDGWVLGDSGYALKSWLMTPIDAPSTPGERRYNKAHKKTRTLVERAFGVLKSRWRILDHTGGRMCYAPARVSKIIVTCIILHNICRRNGTPIIDEADETSPPIIANESRTTVAHTTAGKRQQARLVRFFESQAPR